MKAHAFIVLALAASLVAAPADAAVVESKFELFVHDIESSIAFYEILGFEVAHAKEGGYTTLASGGTVVALSPVPWFLPVHWFGFLRFPPLGTELVFYVEYAEDLERLRGEFDAACHGPSEIKIQSWGDRDFRVRDPDGYYVRISEGSSIPGGD